jgi:ribosomal protein S18 acetylase RimI-like enzyme
MLKLWYNLFMNFETRLAKNSDLPLYTDLLQRTYEDAYSNEPIGLSKDRFSKEIFNTPNTQKYLASNLQVNGQQKCWLVFDKNILIGSVTITERDDDYELRGFYVAPEYQGRGIGKKLWQLALEFVKRKDITCDIYIHNTKTIAMYKKWGFEVDKEKGEFYRHWPEWPENIRAKSIYMRYKIK